MLLATSSIRNNIKGLDSSRKVVKDKEECKDGRVTQGRQRQAEQSSVATAVHPARHHQHQANGS